MSKRLEGLAVMVVKSSNYSELWFSFQSEKKKKQSEL